jgi:GNAT superfamily N-acetyltransferase
MGTNKKTSSTEPVHLRNLKFRPLTTDRWRDFEKLFGERGACGGCWCMWWRLTRAQFERQKGQKNKRAMKKIVNSGEVPGILVYAEGEPIGWCSLGPREDFPSLERSRVLKRVDDRPAWSIVCFFIARPYRKKGVSVKLIEAAVKYARKNGALLIEGYPHELKKEPATWADAFVWTGLASAFRKAGFIEVARRSATRPIMQFTIKSHT